MTKRIYGICEASILVTLGIGILWFALSENYGFLMSEKFRWLTICGAVGLLAMGAVFLTGAKKRSGLNTFVFGLMLLIVFSGKPYLHNDTIMAQPDSSLQKGLWDKIDQSRFPRMDLFELSTSKAEEVYRSGQSFTTVGVAKRLEGLEPHGSFALMTTFMFCCVADMFAVGQRVPYENWENVNDGQWLMVSGKLVREGSEIPLPNFRIGRAMLSSVNKDYYLKPEKIILFDRVGQFPLLSDKIGGETSRLFRRAVTESGFLKDLENSGPFTVFVPVDQAIEDLIQGVMDRPFDSLSQSELRQLVTSHIIKGRFFVRDIMEKEVLENLNGQALQVSLENGKVRIHESRLLFMNVEARNGAIHYIYPAIIPDGWKTKTE